MLDSPWTDRRVAILREMWSAGAPTCQIAARLGVTRNSVIGKAHRIALDARPSPIAEPPHAWRQHETERAVALKQLGHSNAMIARQLGRSATIVAQKTRHLRGPAAKLHEPERGWDAPPAPPVIRFRAPSGPTLRPVLHPTAESCQWPIGEPRTKGFHFCGCADVVEHRPYCKAHEKLAWTRPRVPQVPA